METLLTGSVVLSLFHALIPSHWLPVVAIGRQEQWTAQRVLGVTFLAGLAHVLSTVLIGGGLALFGQQLAQGVRTFSGAVAPAILIVWGLFYLYQHYRHHHFHLHRSVDRRTLIWSLTLAMFFSPCLEIEGYFFAAGQYGIPFVLTLALVYALITIGGMVLWVWFALHGLQRLNWHAWEHNAGLITGLTLIASGIGLILWE
jgi:hypothetical protein